MNTLTDLLTKIVDIVKKYPWTAIFFGVLALISSILYVYYPEQFNTVYQYITDFYNNISKE